MKTESLIYVLFIIIVVLFAIRLGLHMYAGFGGCKQWGTCTRILFTRSCCLEYKPLW